MESLRTSQATTARRTLKDFSWTQFDWMKMQITSVKLKQTLYEVESDVICIHADIFGESCSSFRLEILTRIAVPLHFFPTTMATKRGAIHLAADSCDITTLMTYLKAQWLNMSWRHFLVDWGFLYMFTVITLQIDLLYNHTYIKISPSAIRGL